MKQLSFADVEYAAEKRVRCWERFLPAMEQVVRWAALLAALDRITTRERSDGVLAPRSA